MYCNLQSINGVLKLKVHIDHIFVNDSVKNQLDKQAPL